MTFAEKIRYCRLSMEMSQRELADELDISTRTVNAYESDGAIPRDHNLYNLSRVLCVPLDYLMDDSVNNPPEEFYESCYQHLLKKYRTNGAA